ncbi:hypothetical protein [Paenibacillus piri]|uniref:Uncharacterized protein n=1 Tax=Paenibacillus piri TaxID=2547395 RepID=A0A4V6PID5_9BACL|nr:hypothetical protein [Paenibacillus piri]TDF92744.1 hypothetical protein E1757_28895 [Paenibacillus piri]
MNRVNGVIRMHLRDKGSLLYMPWLILCFSFVVNLIIGAMMREDHGLYTGGISSIYIYMLVIGIITVSQTFPFALGMSIRRKDYFWGTTAVIVGTSALSSVLLLLLGFAESELTGGWGVHLHFFKLPYLNDGSAFAQLWISFALQVHMFFLGFVISSVHRRFGKTGTWILALVMLLVGTVGSFACTYYGWWLPMFGWIAAHSAFQLTLWIFALAIVYAIASYSLLRRATV